jgi:hypothetical protein
MHKIQKVVFTLTLSLHVSMDMLSFSGDTKWYRCQRIRKNVKVRACPLKPVGIMSM